MARKHHYNLPVEWYSNKEIYYFAVIIYFLMKNTSVYLSLQFSCGLITILNLKDNTWC